MANPATYLDYLEIEAAIGLRHEFLDGEIIAMAGGAPSHAELAGRTRDELVVATHKQLDLPRVNHQRAPDPRRISAAASSCTISPWCRRVAVRPFRKILN